MAQPGQPHRFQYASRRREREVYRYLPSFDWNSPPPSDAGDNGTPSEAVRPHQPKSSIDKTLNAFAQLGALRLRTKRAIISLIGQDHQYIIAESTQTLSSQSDSVHQSGDALLMGVRKYNRAQSICGHALASGFSYDFQAQHRDHNEENKEGVEHIKGHENRGITVFHDLSKEELFKNSSFVNNEPRTKFYAGVPIKTKAGFMIGAYAVLDDSPRSRPGITDVELQFLQDMSSTVMEHLEFMAIREEHSRADKMVKALGLFTEGSSSLSDWWLRTDSTGNPSLYYSSASDHIDQLDGGRKPHALSQLTSSISNPALRDTGRSLSVGPKHYVPASEAHVERGPDTENVPEKLEENIIGDKMQTLALHSVDTALASREEEQASPEAPEVLPRVSSPRQSLTTSPTDIKAAFSRAANLIRESTGVEGVIFFKPTPTGFGAMRESHDESGRRQFGGKNRGTGGTSSSDDYMLRNKSSESNYSSSSTIENSADSESSQVRGQMRYCDVMGFSTTTTSSLNGQEATAYQLAVPNDFIKQILRRYPHGKIFVFDEEGRLSSEDESSSIRLVAKDIKLTKGEDKLHRSRISRQDEANAILQIFPGSRSIMVFPMWDFHREKWYASNILWTTDPARVLTKEDDLSYLASFGNNIMAEVSRLEAIAAAHTKSTFISSISHELRSPLHGVMGSLELLRDTRLTHFQLDAMDAIRQCSVTLLDTLSHLLDHAKINNFTIGKRKEARLRRSHKRSRRARPAEDKLEYGTISLASDISLDTITEEVVQAVSLGHQQNQLSAVTDLEGEQSQHIHNASQQPVVVILDTDWTSKWRFHTQSGAWRRIVMNLLGNALKYTTAGFVVVRLICQDTGPAKARPSRSKIILQISDSGKGISKEFIEGPIFTPFAQEDSLSPGTGLGLSIVRQIVENLHGKIDFQSELGLGTSVKVTLPDFLVEQAAPSKSTTFGVIGNEAVKRARTYVENQKLGLILANESSETMQQGSGNYSRQEMLQLLQTALSRMARECFGLEVAFGTELNQVQADFYLCNQAVFDICSRDDASKPTAGSMGGPALIVIKDSVLLKEQPPKHLPLAFLSHPITPPKIANAILSIFDGESKRADHLEEITNSLKPDTAEKLQFAQSLTPNSHNRKFSPLLRPLRGGLVADPSHFRILLVEDNVINMKLLSTYIRKLGYSFDTATDGSLALEYYKEVDRKPAVIFMDISMPVMDGFTASRLIRTHEAENGLPATTIIALTGLASASAQEESYSSGINLFLTKPVPMKDIKKALEDLHF